MKNAEESLIPINDDFEDMLVCALRYSVGRRTYVTKVCSNYVSPLVPKLSNYCLGNINHYFKRYEKDNGDWGMDCDKQEWFKLWGNVKTELKKRGF
jgi:hypothetical protein